MEFKFTEDNIKRIEKSISKYPEKKAAVMDALYVAQEQNGYITNEVMEEIAKILEMPVSDVYGVATFYTMYHKKPVGKYHLQVCTNVSCMLKGGMELLKQLKDELGIEESEVTSDGLFSIEEVECMGACGGAPMISANYDYYENLTPEKLRNLINDLRKKG
ncbi:MAG TPA: NADH-quinone oxidoreductase subunit NuoE [Ignavibacteriales bacterium]|nr:NADH-quinone oxidoreductase subunit NuoE [Ignavibacteriales bacterium]HOL82119.1 NADH-quinone oxidoreductase subunit NuoE [Ignavibacteriales bacterium]HOM65765.1 NADH-quinone oxidoreductase subunit NuoE [Ignavibacteriales bacterium]HPD66953.1 NADH-quinone oxidoreductase subunit NuoE [Ignavibacteriales bacterium]HPP34247.1 NADH-quinone oxidoreductase subunit NuoE [Ignavibacteriales bacterium]